MEEFTLSDKYNGDEYFEGQLKTIADRYGKRIVAVQNTRVVTQVNRTIAGVGAGAANTFAGSCRSVAVVGGPAITLTRDECPLLDI